MTPGRRTSFACAVVIALAGAPALAAAPAHPAAPAKAAAPGLAVKPPTADEARRFVEDAEKKLLILNNRNQRADWVESNFITDDTETMAGEYKEASIAAVTALATQARRYEGMTLPGDVARRLQLLRLSLTLPAPDNDAERAELAGIASWLEGAYGKGTWCPKGDGKDCLDINAISKILAETYDPIEVAWGRQRPSYRCGAALWPRCMKCWISSSVSVPSLSVSIALKMRSCAA